jgi:hypothetical protein
MRVCAQRVTRLTLAKFGNFLVMWSKTGQFMNNSWIINYLYEMNVNLEMLYEMNMNFKKVIHFVHFGALTAAIGHGGPLKRQSMALTKRSTAWPTPGSQRRNGCRTVTHRPYLQRLARERLRRSNQWTCLATVRVSLPRDGHYVASFSVVTQFS